MYTSFTSYRDISLHNEIPSLIQQLFQITCDSVLSHRKPKGIEVLIKHTFKIHSKYPTRR